MIGKPEWFQRRKYGGWGITPKTWQGWVYIAAIVIPLFVFNSIPSLNLWVRLGVFGAWLLLVIVDTLDIMAKIKKDERERIHEAIAERNALWAVMVILVAGVGYHVARSVVLQRIEIDWFIVAALFVALIVKSISNLYLDKKD